MFDRADGDRDRGPALAPHALIEGPVCSKSALSDSEVFFQILSTLKGPFAVASASIFCVIKIRILVLCKKTLEIRRQTNIRSKLEI